MPPHRIFKSEADEPRPLAYLRMLPRGRRRAVGYLVAALAGGLAVLAAVAALAALQHGFPV